MPTPRERLENVFKCYTPTKVVFKAAPQQGDSKFIIQAKTISQLQVRTSDDPLQAALANQMGEQWDQQQCGYYIRSNPMEVYDTIKRKIVRDYEKYSIRCAATKRKTVNFIYGVGLDEKHLPNFFLSMFIDMAKDTYDNKSRTELQAFFEPLESLRKTYGKRR